MDPMKDTRRQTNGSDALECLTNVTRRTLVLTHGLFAVDLHSLRSRVDIVDDPLMCPLTTLASVLLTWSQVLFHTRTIHPQPARAFSCLPQNSSLFVPVILQLFTNRFNFKTFAPYISLHSSAIDLCVTKTHGLPSCCSMRQRNMDKRITPKTHK